MILLSIFEFESSDTKLCTREEIAPLLVFMLIDPFTYNFFNPVLDYFICPEESGITLYVQVSDSIIQIFLGAIILWVLIYLDDREASKILRSEVIQKS
jgi:hypothetical protein